MPPLFRPAASRILFAPVWLSFRSRSPCEKRRIPSYFLCYPVATFPPFSSWQSCIRAGKEQSRPKRKGKGRKEYAGESMASFKDSLYAKTSPSVGIQVSTAASLSSKRHCLPFFPPPRLPTAVKCRAWALISFQFCLLVLHSQRFFGFSFERSRLESLRKRHPISSIVHSLFVSRSIRTLLPSFSNPFPSLFFRRFSPRENETPSLPSSPTNSFYVRSKCV